MSSFKGYILKKSTQTPFKAFLEQGLFLASRDYEWASNAAVQCLAFVCHSAQQQIEIVDLEQAWNNPQKQVGHPHNNSVSLGDRILDIK